MGRRWKGWPKSLGSAALALAIAGSVVAIAPALFADGIIATRAAGDSPFNLLRVHEMGLALTDGHIPPRWMPSAAYGMGYPFWNYYSPLVWLWAGTVAMIGGGVPGAVKVTQALCFVLAAWGAYRLAAETWDSPAAGFLGAAAYTFAPYHLVNVYARGDALSELGAYAVFPWLLVAVRAAVRHPGPRRIVGLAAATAALLLAHNISAVLFLPVLMAAVVWHLATVQHAPDTVGAARGGDGADPQQRGRPRGRRSRSLRRPETAPAALVRRIERRSGAGGPPPSWVVGLGLRVARWEWRLWPWPRRIGGPVVAVGSGLLLGGLLAAWFWGPALLERGLVQLEQATTGYFDVANHFLGWEMLDLAPLYSYAAEAGAPVRTGLLQWLPALLGVAGAWWLRTVRRGPLIFWSAVAVAVTFMMTPLSEPVWRGVPLLTFAQFPWRWLSVQALALAMLTAPIVTCVERWLPPVRWAPLAAATAVAAAMAISAMGALETDVIAVAEPDRSDLQAFELLSGNIGSTVRGEYLPVGVDPAPVSGLDVGLGRGAGPVAISGTVQSATLQRRESGRQEWRITVSGADPARVVFPTHWFPGWRYSVDHGTPRSAGAAHGTGWMTVRVPSGEHEVWLWLDRSPVRALAELATLLALGAVAVLWLAVPGESGGRDWAMVLVPVMVLAGSAVLARTLPDGIPEPSDRPPPVVMDLTLSPWPNVRADGIRFGRSRLTSLTTTDRSGLVSAGGTLGIVPGWSPGRDDYVTEIALVSPAAPRFGVPYTLASAHRVQDEAQTFELKIPDDTPPGAYFVRIRVQEEDGAWLPAESAAGRALGPIYVGPVRITTGSNLPGMGAEDGTPSRGEAAGDEAEGSGAPSAPDATPTTPSRDGSPVLRMPGLVLLSATADRVPDDPEMVRRAGGSPTDRLVVSMTWRADRVPELSYKTSVRLLDARGDAVRWPDEDRVVQEDKVPRYGFPPPMAWPLGRTVPDRRWIEIPPDLPAGRYGLEIVVYDGASGDELAIGRVERIELAARAAP